MPEEMNEIFKWISEHMDELDMKDQARVLFAYSDFFEAIKNIYNKYHGKGTFYMEWKNE